MGGNSFLKAWRNVEKYVRCLVLRQQEGIWLDCQFGGGILLEKNAVFSVMHIYISNNSLIQNIHTVKITVSSSDTPGSFFSLTALEATRETNMCQHSLDPRMSCRMMPTCIYFLDLLWFDLAACCPSSHVLPMWPQNVTRIVHNNMLLLQPDKSHIINQGCKR